jgi:hypothetical protein
MFKGGTLLPHDLNRVLLIALTAEDKDRTELATEFGYLFSSDLRAIIRIARELNRAAEKELKLRKSPRGVCRLDYPRESRPGEEPVRLLPYVEGKWLPGQDPHEREEANA